MNIKYWFNFLLEYINALILRVYEPIKLKPAKKSVTFKL